MSSEARRPRLLIIGHGRHGKDTAAGLFARLGGYRFASSSEFAAQKAVFPLMSDIYATWQDCFADRAAHRELWFHAIAAYNRRPGPTLAEQILAEHEIYVGMRRRDEFERTRHLFDLVLWVDRSAVLPAEPGGSMELSADDADMVLDNNQGTGFLAAQVLDLIGRLESAPGRPERHDKMGSAQGDRPASVRTN